MRERKRYTPKRTDVGVTLNCSVVTRAATMGVFLVCYMCVFACVLYGILKERLLPHDPDRMNQFVGYKGPEAGSSHTLRYGSKLLYQTQMEKEKAP